MEQMKKGYLTTLNENLHRDLQLWENAKDIAEGKQ